MEGRDYSKFKYVMGYRFKAPMVFTSDIVYQQRLVDAGLFVTAKIDENVLPLHEQACINNVHFAHVPGKARPLGWEDTDPIVEADISKDNITILKSSHLADFKYDSLFHGDVIEYTDEDGNIVSIQCQEPKLPSNFEETVVNTSYSMLRTYQNYLIESGLAQNTFHVLSNSVATLKNGGCNLVMVLYFPKGKKFHTKVPFKLFCEDGSICFVVPNPIFYKVGSDIQQYDVVFNTSYPELQFKIMNTLNKVLESRQGCMLSGSRITGKGNLVCFVKHLIEKEVTTFEEDLRLIALNICTSLQINAKVFKK
jgi:hypothetical protein